LRQANTAVGCVFSQLDQRRVTTFTASSAQLVQPSH
jgi:hypothetical protein